MMLFLFFLLLFVMRPQTYGNKEGLKSLETYSYYNRKLNRTYSLSFSFQGLTPTVCACCLTNVIDGLPEGLLQTDESSSKMAENVSSLFYRRFFFQITIKKDD